MELTSLLERIDSRKAVISVIGLGYVGLPIALKFAEAGFKVIGLDNSAKKVQMLNSRESYIDDIDNDYLKEIISTKKFKATTDESELKKADAIIICVPTPITIHKDPDLSFVIQATETISRHLNKGMLVVLESTTYPGTTENVMLPLLESSGLKTGKDFFLSYSPERIDPGNKKFSFEEIPKVVSGLTKNCLRAAVRLYGSVYSKLHQVSTTQVAESTKLLENIHRAVNIALVNEMKIILDRLNIDVWEVIEAASTKPFGFTPYYPGPGLGGHCIPIDPFYMAWKAREVDTTTRFIELAGIINRKMPYTVVTKVGESLNSFKMNFLGSRILLLGVAYKKDIRDFRETPALKIIKLLEDKGAKVFYNDDFIPHLSEHWYSYKIDKRSWKLDYSKLNTFDCTVIITDHSYYDWDLVVKHSKAVVDTRNATKHVRKYRKRITKA